jgi:hypothetical protein
MIHPETEVRQVSEAIGCGVFATAPLPLGTLVWVPDPLDRTFTHRQVLAWPREVREATLRYMYRDYRGRYVLGWDHARYVNHSFTPNCLITPFGFTLAIRDIAAGEELREDYGTLNIIEAFRPQPEPGSRRRTVQPNDLEHHADDWDLAFREALMRSAKIPQPLSALLTPEMKRKWRSGLRAPDALPSLRTLLAPPPPAAF